jgi:surface antigen
MMSKRMIAALIALPLLGACQSSSPTREHVGMTSGAVLGSVAGPQVAYRAADTGGMVSAKAVGAFLASPAGAYMDRNDQLKTAQALETAKDREVTTWRNRDTGQRYSVTPTRTYNSPSGPCREFTTIAQLDDGRHRIVHGSACRQADGTWKAA